jgi:ATP-binding cassette subfamily B protein
MSGLRRMAPFVAPYRWVVVLMIVTVILPVAMELIVPRALSQVIDQGIEKGEMSEVLSGGGIMLLAALVGVVATLGQGVCRAWLSQGLAYDMRNRLFSHVQGLSFANLDQMQTGQLMTRLSSDVDVVRMFVSSGVALLLRALLMIAGSMGIMLLTDWRLTLVMILMLVLSGTLILIVLRIARPLFTIVQQKLANLNTLVQENLAGVQLVKAFVREGYEVERFAASNHTFMAENIRVGRLMAVAQPALSIITNLGLVAIIYLGGVSVGGGRLSVGELVAFNNYLLIGMAPLLLLSNILTMMTQADASAARVWELLDAQPRIQPTPRAHRAAAINGRISFSDVSFRYDGLEKEGQLGSDPLQGPVATTGVRGGGRRVLAGVDFAVEPGRRVAILGATGSGKSTLVNLICRFYDVNQGCVKIDGIDVRDWHPDSLRSGIGMVLQQTTLFSGTIRDNIAFGRPRAPLDEIIAAAKAAQAHDFIQALPDGYDHVVEERGANLSGGQKQRLAIARALLVSPGILILDDSTSAVDLETEGRIQEALQPLMAGRTTIVIAQRIQSVLSADKILLLDHGQVIAQGTHVELLGSSPIYRQIVESQLGSDLDAVDLLRGVT